MYQISLVLLLVLHISFSVQSSEDIEIEKLAEGVWMHTSYYKYPNGNSLSSNGMIVENQKQLILIDSARGEIATKELLLKIEDEIGLPVSQAIVTHAHLDRIAGVDYLESKGIEVYAHPLTQKLAIQAGLPVVDKVFESFNNGSRLKFENLQLAYFGAAHAEDNILVWHPESKTLFGGCAIRALESKSLGNIKQADLQNWTKVMKQSIFNFKNIIKVIPGHGEIGDKSLIEHTINLIESS